MGEERAPHRGTWVVEQAQKRVALRRAERINFHAAKGTKISRMAQQGNQTGAVFFLSRISPVWLNSWTDIGGTWLVRRGNFSLAPRAGPNRLLRRLAISVQRGADSDKGAARGHSDFEVSGHAHRKLGQRLSKTRRQVVT